MKKGCFYINYAFDREWAPAFANIYEGLRMQQEMECQNSLEPSGTSGRRAVPA